MEYKKLVLVGRHRLVHDSSPIGRSVASAGNATFIQHWHGCCNLPGMLTFGSEACLGHIGKPGKPSPMKSQAYPEHLPILRKDVLCGTIEQAEETAIRGRRHRDARRHVSTPNKLGGGRIQKLEIEFRLGIQAQSNFDVLCTTKGIDTKDQLHRCDVSRMKLAWKLRPTEGII